MNDKDKLNPQADTPPTPKDPLDINANLGSFGDDPVKQVVANAETSLNTEAITEFERIEETANMPANDKLKKEHKIDFEKFSRVKPSRFNNKLIVKMDIWLKQPKSLLWVWVIIAAIIAVLLGAQITYIIVNNNILKNHTIPMPQNIPIIHSCGHVAIIFSYISMCLPAAPFIFMLTSWIIGVNGIHSSRLFHMFLWITLLVSIICLIISTTLSGILIGEYNSFIR